MKPIKMKKIIQKKVYNTETAELISGDDHWDGHNYERKGRNEFLYKTQKGNYFLLKLTQWQGEQNDIISLTLDEAIQIFESHSEKRVEFEEAFPGEELEEA